MKPTIALLACLLAAVCSGCVQAPAQRELVERPQLKVDPEVACCLNVAELFQERLRQSGGHSLLQIQFAVEARTRLSFGWSVTWFDSQGMKVKGVGEGYRRASVLPGQPRYFTAVAPHPRAVDYQLHLRILN